MLFLLRYFIHKASFEEHAGLRAQARDRTVLYRAVEVKMPLKISCLRELVNCAGILSVHATTMQSLNRQGILSFVYELDRFF